MKGDQENRYPLSGSCSHERGVRCRDGAFMSTSLRAGDAFFITLTRVNKNMPTVKVVASHKDNSTTITYLGMACRLT
jgi:hypothetical protein